jgi:hypothetical protein
VNVRRRGIQLDSDQFVAPGVDELFQLAKREGSETYPLPILPVHFMRNEELPMFPSVNGGFTMSGGVSHVFDRYCKHGKLGEAFFFPYCCSENDQERLLFVFQIANDSQEL